MGHTNNIDKQRSFAETLAFIVAEVYECPENLIKLEKIGGAECGFIERQHICIDWAIEFEKLHDGRFWDGEWIEELEAFTQTKLNSQLEQLQPVVAVIPEPLDNDKVIAMSKEFARVLREWLTPDEMQTVIERNKQEDYKGNCATHDFCDANMAIDEAFTKVMGREFVFYNDEEEGTEKQNSIDTDYCNAAWEVAKQNEFSI